MVGTTGNDDRILKGIMLRIGSVAALSVMNALIKLDENRGAHLAEIMFFRQTFAMPVVTCWIWLGPGLRTIRTARFGAQVRRTASGLVSMCFVVGTVLLLPLAESST